MNPNQLERELQEQAVLLSKGAEREARLLGRVGELQHQVAALRDAATIIRNALEEYDSDGVNGNQYRLINTVRRAISNIARKEAQP